MKVSNIFASLTLFTCLFFHCYGDVQYTPIKDKRSIPIITPSIAEQKTEKIRLPNGLEALLISDPKAPVSGAVLSIKVGSWDDPVDHPGLAHYLEHMLFMGTKSYPDESEYERYIYDHNGTTNAFTASSSTSYLFTVDSSAFKGALERFSSFFKEPLFNPSGSDRELKAIDQEYGKNLDNDDIRQYYVLKALSNESHPFHEFNMGNRKSLEHTDHNLLKKWFDDNYSANIMRLVVYSSLPLEKIRDEVVNNFSQIPNKGKSPLITKKPLFTETTQGKFVYVEPITNKRNLSLYWELPAKFAHTIDTQPGRLICHVLGDEGEKSLLAQLKREKLADSITCGSSKLGNDLFLAYLEIGLTEEGLQDVERVVTRTFQAIKAMHQQEMPDYLFDEVQTMATVEYQYPSKKREFMMLMGHAYDILDEDIETYPEKTKVPQKFDRALTMEFLEAMSPKNTRYIIMAPSKQSKVKPDQVEPWLGVSYAIKPISKEQMAFWKSIAPMAEMGFPEKNIFIPDGMTYKIKSDNTLSKRLPIPKTAMNNSFGKIYFATDQAFGIPKIKWILKVRTPQIDLRDPNKIVLADLYVKALTDHLSKISYPASLAGLKLEIDRKDNGIELAIEGYSAKAELFLKKILEGINSYQTTQEKFKIYKESLTREYQNFAKKSPIDQSIETLESIIYQSYVTEKEKANAIRKITFDKYENYVNVLFANTFIEGILYGDMTPKDGDDVVADIQNTFNKAPYPKSEWFQIRAIILPKDEGPFYLDTHTKAFGNATLLAVENSEYSFKERAAQQIMMQAIREPFFTRLRTQQQTGYIVYNNAEEIERKLFNLFAVQSNTHSPRDLLARFEEFIESYIMELGKTELTEKQFNNIKKTQISLLENSVKNIEQMADLLNHLAFKYDGDFLWVSKRIQAMKELTYSDTLKLTREFLGKQNRQRLAILLTGELPDDQVFSYTRARTGNAIRKLSEYEGRIADREAEK